MEVLWGHRCEDVMRSSPQDLVLDVSFSLLDLLPWSDWFEILDPLILVAEDLLLCYSLRFRVFLIELPPCGCSKYHRGIGTEAMFNLLQAVRVNTSAAVNTFPVNATRFTNTAFAQEALLQRKEQAMIADSLRTELSGKCCWLLSSHFVGV
jgi:hypothetical protein